MRAFAIVATLLIGAALPSPIYPAPRHAASHKTTARTVAPAHKNVSAKASRTAAKAPAASARKTAAAPEKTKRTEVRTKQAAALSRKANAREKTAPVQPKAAAVPAKATRRGRAARQQEAVPAVIRTDRKLTARERRQQAKLQRVVLTSRSRRLAPSDSRANQQIDPVPLRQLAMPAPLRGTHESLVRQNTRAEQDGLKRIEDDADLARLVSAHELVPLPASSALAINPDMPYNRRYVRAWTATFLTNLARVHQQRFRSPLMVNSAVRTVEYQRKLILVNGNAAPAEGDIASPHLTGATIDIAKKGLSQSEIGWMRAYLLPLQSIGKIDVAEEFQQACFHITVYKSYAPPAQIPVRRTVPLMATRMH